MIAAVRVAALDQAEVLARMAVEETGLGRVDDKTTKNRLVARKAPGPEDLEVEAVTGTDGMMITEFAPFGVVGAITPVTNPAVTVINNSISIVSAGNAVVFNPHPSARRVSNAARPAREQGHRRRRRPGGLRGLHDRADDRVAPAR